MNESLFDTMVQAYLVMYAWHIMVYRYLNAHADTSASFSKLWWDADRLWFQKAALVSHVERRCLELLSSVVLFWFFPSCLGLSISDVAALFSGLKMSDNM